MEIRTSITNQGSDKGGKYANDNQQQNVDFGRP